MGATTGLTINGYFVGEGKGDDGQYKAAIIVPSKGKDKRKWPKVTFTGESLTSKFSDLKKGAVVIRIDDGLTRKTSKDKGAAKKGEKFAIRKKGGKGGAGGAQAHPRGAVPGGKATLVSVALLSCAVLGTNLCLLIARLRQPSV